MTNIITDTADLARLWPRLSDALAKDHAPTYGERVSAAGSTEPGLPVNLDVADTMNYLAASIPAAAAYARRLLGEPAWTHSVDVLLAWDFTRWHGRLVDLGDQHHAQLLAAAVADWLARARRALGFTAPDRRLGSMCPEHDEPLVELVEPAAYATLHDDGKAGHRITWTTIRAVYCRFCRATWTRGPGFLALDRALVAATRRRIRPAAAA